MGLLLWWAVIILGSSVGFLSISPNHLRSITQAFRLFSSCYTWVCFYSFPQKCGFVVVLGDFFVAAMDGKSWSRNRFSLELRSFCTVPVEIQARGFKSYAPVFCISSILDSSILICSFPYSLKDLPQRKVISKEFQIIFSVLNNLAFAATEYYFILMDTLKYLNTVFAHCFIVFMGKTKLMISRSDATGQMLSTET